MKRIIRVSYRRGGVPRSDNFAADTTADALAQLREYVGTDGVTVTGFAVQCERVDRTTTGRRCRNFSPYARCHRHRSRYDEHTPVLNDTTL